MIFPILAANITFAPHLAAAIAWLDPLPPLPCENVDASTVSLVLVDENFLELDLLRNLGTKNLFT